MTSIFPFSFGAARRREKIRKLIMSFIYNFCTNKIHTTCQKFGRNYVIKNIFVLLHFSSCQLPFHLHPPFVLFSLFASQWCLCWSPCNESFESCSKRRFRSWLVELKLAYDLIVASSLLCFVSEDPASCWLLFFTFCKFSVLCFDLSWNEMFIEKTLIFTITSVIKNIVLKNSPSLVVYDRC